MTSSFQSERAERRRSPRWFDTDWLLLSRLNTAIGAMAARIVPAELPPGTAMIDLGSGSRPYESLFRSHGLEYRGADLGEEAEIRIDAAGIAQAADASAGLIGSFQVLEHIRHLDVYLGEARRLLQPDGLMMLSTHGTWLYHPHPEDHRRWTRQGLYIDLEARGFTVLDCVAILGPLAWTTIIRLTGFSFVLRRVPLLGYALAGLCALVMNARAVLEDTLTPASIKADNACVYLVLCRRT